MDPATLESAVWRPADVLGRGIDAQHVLPSASPETVREHVRRIWRHGSPAAATSSTTYTTSRRACRRRTSWPCTTRRMSSGSTNRVGGRGKRSLPVRHFSGRPATPARAGPRQAAGGVVSLWCGRGRWPRFCVRPPSGPKDDWRWSNAEGSLPRPASAQNCRFARSRKGPVCLSIVRRNNRCHP